MASQNSDEFLVERTTIVKAEAPVVFALIKRFPSVDSVVAVGRSRPGDAAYVRGS